MTWLICLLAIAVPGFSRPKRKIDQKPQGMVLRTDGTQEIVIPWSGTKFHLPQIWTLIDMKIGIPDLEYLVGSDRLFLIHNPEAKKNKYKVNAQATILREKSSMEEAKMFKELIEAAMGPVVMMEVTGHIHKIYGTAFLVHGDFIGEEE